MQPGKPHELVKPLCWLLGTWKSVKVLLKRKLNLPMSEYCPLFKANAYDTTNEVIKFCTFGNPSIKYEAIAYHPKNLFPLRMEIGHLLCHPDSQKISIVAAHNYGMAGVEFGKINGECIEMCTLTVGNAELVPKSIIGYCRSFRINDQGQLVYKMKIRTEDDHKLKDYSRIVYEKEVKTY